MEKGTHNDTWAVEMGKYLRCLKDFMDKANSKVGATRLANATIDPTIRTNEKLHAQAQVVHEYRQKLLREA